jgi:hypothetical protein
MRSTRVAAVLSAAAAEGLERSLSQAAQRLQHVKDTELADLGREWVQHAESIRQCMSSHVKVFDSVGRFPLAKEQQLLSFYQLVCATLIQVLNQAPALVAKYQPTPSHASSDTADGKGSSDQQAASNSSSSSSSSGGSSSSSKVRLGRALDEELAAEYVLTGLLRELLPATTDCEVCLEHHLESIAIAVRQSGGCIAAKLCSTSLKHALNSHYVWRGAGQSMHAPGMLARP